MKIDESSGQAMCPACDHELDAVMCHLRGVAVNAGGRITVIEGRRGPEQSIGTPEGRGTNIRVSLFCEAGHAFAFVFQFHKGCVSWELQREEDRDVDPAFSVSVPEMWRS